MSRRNLRRGQRHGLLVRRVLAMRVAIGDRRAILLLDIARTFGVPIHLIFGRRDL